MNKPTKVKLPVPAQLCKLIPPHLVPNATDEQCPSLIWELLSDGNTVAISSATMSDIGAMLELITNGIDSATDLAQELGKSKGTISKWASKLQDQGHIKINGKKYKPATR